MHGMLDGLLKRMLVAALIVTLIGGAVGYGIAQVTGQTDRTTAVSIHCLNAPSETTASCTIMGDIASHDELTALAGRIDALAAPMTLQQVTDRIDTLVNQRMASYAYLLDYPTYGRFSDDLYYVQTSNGVIMTPRQIAGIVINSNLAGMHDHLNDHLDAHLDAQLADTAASHDHVEHNLNLGETFTFTRQGHYSGVIPIRLPSGAYHFSVTGDAPNDTAQDSPGVRLHIHLSDGTVKEIDVPLDGSVDGQRVHSVGDARHRVEDLYIHSHFGTVHLEVGYWRQDGSERSDWTLTIERVAHN